MSAGPRPGCASWPTGCSAATGWTWRSPTRPTGACGPPRRPCQARSSGSGSSWPSASCYGIEALGRELGAGLAGRRAAGRLEDRALPRLRQHASTTRSCARRCTSWPAPEWTPDVDYNVNEFYLLDGDKFSTSRRHAIWGKDILSPDSVDGIRYYLALTRPEARRTNFTVEEYERMRRADPDRHLAALAERPRRPGRASGYGGSRARRRHLDPRAHRVPGPAGQQARRDDRRAGPGRVLAEPGRAGRWTASSTTRCGSRPSRRRPPGSADWKDEARTAIALELAAARLLAHCAAPVMPRFATRLAARARHRRARSSGPSW